MGIGTGTTSGSNAFLASLTFAMAPAATDYIVIGDVHYNGADAYAASGGYTTINDSAGFKTMGGTGMTTNVQNYAIVTEAGGNADYSAYAYDLQNVSPTNPVNAMYNNLAQPNRPVPSSVTVTLTTTVANCYGIVFLYSDNNSLPAVVTDPNGLTRDFSGVNDAGSAMIAYHSTTPLPLGTTSYTFTDPSVNGTPVNLVGQGVAIAPSSSLTSQQNTRVKR
jgi:hypothetical protein